MGSELFSGRRHAEEHYPDEAKRRDLLGKFYYRPPGGESWADVALRIRSVLATEGLRLRLRAVAGSWPTRR